MSQRLLAVWVTTVPTWPPSLTYLTTPRMLFYFLCDPPCMFVRGERERETSVQCQVSLGLAPPCLLRPSPSLNLELTNSGRLAGQRTASICLSLLPSTEMTDTRHISRQQARVLGLALQILHPLSPLPIPGPPSINVSFSPLFPVFPLFF